MNESSVDVIVIGAGIAGASAAYELAANRSVLLVEREPEPGYHSTGRSAALFVEAYGGIVSRTLTVASGEFFRSPPAGFARAPLVAPRASLYVGSEEQIGIVQQLYEQTRALTPAIRLIGGDQAREMCHVLRKEACVSAVYDPASMDIDVNELHQSYLRGARARGTVTMMGHAVSALEWDGTRWHVRVGDRHLVATFVVNAAGAWADETAALAGANALGLEPLRRTAITFDAPDERARGWPAVFDIGDQWYMKPDAGRLMASPADETRSSPCDAQPEELDVATVVDRIESATSLRIRRIASKWAGLRVFAPDRLPVVGFDAERNNFLWLSGQGGTGIQSAPALAVALASLLEVGDLPAELRSLGLTREALSPTRLRQ